MIYSIADNNLRIVKSYKYQKTEMLYRLEQVKYLFPKSNVWRRSMYSLQAEWCVHNALYRLRILRSHTADVDLNYPNRMEWLYIYLSPLARLIIK